jgi:hypothetical protein
MIEQQINHTEVYANRFPLTLLKLSRKVKRWIERLRSHELPFLRGNERVSRMICSQNREFFLADNQCGNQSAEGT